MEVMRGRARMKGVRLVHLRSQSEELETPQLPAPHHLLNKKEEILLLLSVCFSILHICLIASSLCIPTLNNFPLQL